MKGSSLKKIQPNRKDRKRLRHKWKKGMSEEEHKHLDAVIRLYEKELKQAKKQAGEK